MASATEPVLCCDIGGSYLRVGVSPRSGEVREIARVATPTERWDDFIATLRALVDGARHEVPAATACCLAIAGVIERDTGLLTASNIPALHGRAAATLAEAIGGAVSIANDADCFVLAEAVAGRGRGHPVVFGAILGSGVGGALAVHGRPVAGAGEWGHGPVLSVRPAGEPPVSVPRLPCPCGQIGCPDTIGGARGLERLHAVLHGATHSSREILTAWHGGDAAARQTLSVYVELIAEPLAFVVNVTHASIVCVGGGLARDTTLLTALDATVRRNILNDPGRPLVVQAQHLDDGGLLGAAEWARLENPM